MKSCPTCNRTYPDDTLAFCLMDGSVLSAPYDPFEKRSYTPPTEVFSESAAAGEPRSPQPPTIQARAPVASSSAATVQPRAVGESQGTAKLVLRITLGARGVFALAFVLTSANDLYLFGGIQFAAYAFCGGVLTIVGSLKARQDHLPAKLLLVDGFLLMLFGAAFVVARGGFEFFIGIYVVTIASGALTIGQAIKLRKHMTRTLLLGSAGAASILFGLSYWGIGALAFLSPLRESWSFLTGCALGGFLIAFAVFARNEISHTVKAEG